MLRVELADRDCAIPYCYRAYSQGNEPLTNACSGLVGSGLLWKGAWLAAEAQRWIARGEA